VAEVKPRWVGLRGIELETISLASLMGISSSNAEVSPFLKGVPMFEVPKAVLEKIEQKRQVR
jgi:hypothetical protein